MCLSQRYQACAHTTDFVVSASGNTVTLQSASNTADEITVHVIGILQHSNFVQTTGGTFTGTVAHTGTLDVSGGLSRQAPHRKTAIVDGGKGNLTKSDVGLGNVTNDAQVPASGGTFSGDVTHNGNITMATNKKIKQKGAFMQSSTHQALVLLIMAIPSGWDRGFKKYYVDACFCFCNFTGVAVITFIQCFQ